MRSMTGFGRAVQGSVVVEVKTVNHKGLDVKLRLPRSLHAQEQALTQQVRQRLERGRVDVTIELAEARAGAVVVDEARVAEVVAAARALHAKHPEIEPKLTAAELLKMPGVLVDAGAADEAGVEEAAANALASALDELDQSRVNEGTGLLLDLQGRRRTIGELVEEITRLTTTSQEEKRQKWTQKLQALASDLLEPARLASEALLLVEKLDVSEELARLRLHLDALDGLLSKSGTGRKLDFLCQELLREANTTASKCQDAGVAQKVVDLKAEIERLREQSQNVE